ncbi:MAG: TIGR03943 family putative permease subunit [Candidatus Nanopelagicales bacterium]
MTREVQSIILLLVGIATLRISWGTTYLNYVKESMRPWLLVSGVILVVLGAWLLIDAMRARPASGAKGDEPGTPTEGADDGHAHSGPRAAWLLLIPVLTIFLVAPPALGAYSASRDTTNSIATDRSMAPLPPGDPVTLYLSDYVTRAVWDGGRTLVGRSVSLTGFVLAQPDGSWLLARMQLNCCAADAFASKVRPVNTPPDAGLLTEGSWVTLTGTWIPSEGVGTEETIPLVEVTGLVVIEEPTNPYD